MRNVLFRPLCSIYWVFSITITIIRGSGTAGLAGRLASEKSAAAESRRRTVKATRAGTPAW